MRLVRRIYELTGRFPDSERYGLASQMCRAAVSVPSNIAEQPNDLRGQLFEILAMLNGLITGTKPQSSRTSIHYSLFP